MFQAGMNHIKGSAHWHIRRPGTEAMSKQHPKETGLEGLSQLRNQYDGALGDPVFSLR